MFSNATVSRVLLLGAGASSATPMTKCLSSEEPCEVCIDALKNPTSKNRRSNPSLLVEYRDGTTSAGEKKNILIDMGKTFKETYQIHLKENVLAATTKLSIEDRWSPRVSAVLLSHFHADAILGLDDVRELMTQGTNEIPLYCDDVTLQHVKKVFPYLFPKEIDPKIRRWVGSVKENVIQSYLPFHVDSLRIHPIPLDHGDCTAYGYLFPLPNGKILAYLSDLGNIEDDQIAKIKNYGPIDVLFIDCIVAEEVKFKNPAHLGGQRTIDAAKKIGAKRTFTVGMNHSVDYYSFKERLTKEAFEGADGSGLCSIEPGWDRMELDFTSTTHAAGAVSSVSSESRMKVKDFHQQVGVSKL